MAADPGGRLAVVVGAGVSGLTAAWRLRLAGARVLVLEASERIGGQVHTVPFAGMPLDVGAEAVHLAAPGMPALLAELGLADSVVRSGPGGTWLGTARGLRRLPAGVGPYGPTHLAPVVRSGILSPWGLARAAAEPWLARRPQPPGEQSVFDFVTARFGHEVAQRLVDPMLGGLHSGDIRRLSLDAVAPALAAAARAGQSLTLSRAARRGRAGGAPAAFATWAGGLRALPEGIAAVSGAQVRTGWRVGAVSAVAGGYRVRRVAAPESARAESARAEALPADALRADAVVLAVPSRVAVGLLGELAPDAAAALDGQRFASVATVTAAFPRPAARACPALCGTGILMPSTSARVLKAATFLGTKWPHLSAAPDFLLRMSAGRVGSHVADELDDDALVGALLRDLGELTGLTASPTEVLVQRWPQGLGQLEVGHPRRMAAARSALAQHPGVVLAGASYDGIGLGSCVQSGNAAAAMVLGAWEGR